MAGEKLKDRINQAALKRAQRQAAQRKRKAAEEARPYDDCPFATQAELNAHLASLRTDFLAREEIRRAA